MPSPPPSSHLVLDVETVPDTELYAPPEAAPGVERPFPPLYACRLVVIGVMWLDEAMGCRRIATLGDGQDEAAMLAELGALMHEWRPRLVSWNGRTFGSPLDGAPAGGVCTAIGAIGAMAGARAARDGSDCAMGAASSFTNAVP